MKKITGIGVTRQPIDVRATIKVEQGSLVQAYENLSGSFVPDRTATPTILAVDIAATNANTASGTPFSANVTSVRWFYRMPGDASYTEAPTLVSKASVFRKDGLRLRVERNLSEAQSGTEVYALATFEDANDPTLAAQTVSTGTVSLDTSADAQADLSLVMERGAATDCAYVGDGYAINPFTSPQDDAGTAWRRRVRCQLYNGPQALAPAHNGTEEAGNAYYFWYERASDGSDRLLTGQEDWFECEKYSDGTFANEAVVDLAKRSDADIVCRAGYVPYGSLVDVTDSTGAIKPSAIGRPQLRCKVSLRVAQPPIQDIEVRKVRNPSVTRQQASTASERSSVHVVRQAVVTAGGTCVNETANPVTGKVVWTVDGEEKYADTAKSMPYSDLVARCYSIKWTNAETGEQLGTGEWLDVTLEQLGVTGPDAIPRVYCFVEPKADTLFGDNYVVGYSASSDDVVPVETHGTPDFLRQLEFMLFDATDNADADGNARTAFPARLLKRNNLLRYADDSYAPTVGVTADQEAECKDNALYSDAACKTVAYAKGAYGDGTREWESFDKALMAAGGKPRTLYRKASDGTVSEVSHKLRPWETTETKYSIGVGFTVPVYLLDQVRGESGTVWKGIFTDVTTWDGIDLTPYRLEPTAMGPGAFTTIGGKARNFFYLYRPDDENSQGEAGNGGVLSPFNEDRAYPRAKDVSQVTGMTYCRACNADTSSPVPMAEGGFFCLDTLVTAVELMAGTKYLHGMDKFGSGISSDDWIGGTSAPNFFKAGGVRYKTASATDYTYNTWGTSHKATVGGTTTTATWSSLANQERPKEQCMEGQMAASMAVELGIEPTTASGSENFFYLYGGKYYYMAVDGMAAPADGQMNCRVYKVVDDGYTDDSDGAVEIQYRLRMSLYAGLTLAGDTYTYCGGGAELVVKAVSIESAKYGNPVGFWLQPSQEDWKKISTANLDDESASFGFEDPYINVLPLDGNTVTTQNGWRKDRIALTPFAVDSSSASKGDCMVVSNENYYNNSKVNRRTRLALRFGLSASHGGCAPRSLHCNSAASNGTRYIAGRAQARVSLTQ